MKPTAIPQFGRHTAFGLSTLLAVCATARAADDADAQAKKPDTAWKTSAAIGATLTRGNSKTLTVNGTIDTVKKWKKNEFGAGGYVTYGEDDGDTTANNYGLYSQYNRLFTERFFAFARVDYQHDELADLDYRVALNPGVGYYFLKDDKFTLAGEVGPGYVWEKLGNERDDFATLHVGERFTWEINDRARLWQNFGYEPELEDFGNYLITAEIGFETDIITNLSLRVVGRETYRSDPAPGRYHNDFQLITGVAYKF
jgi:putative salt-induced outer membrane protein YdiY